MPERQLTELDVRHMLEHARRHHRGRHRGRWIILARLGGVRWGIVVPPRPDQEVMRVVTVIERNVSG
jgi:hypothetical protein